MSLVLCSLYSRHPLLSSGLSLSCLPSGQEASETGQNGAKVRIYLVCFGVFSGICETERGEKQRYIWNVGRIGAGCEGFGCLLLACHWCRWSGNSCYFADVSKNGRNPSFLSAFLPCLCAIALEYGSISRFKGVFSGF